MNIKTKSRVTIFIILGLFIATKAYANQWLLFDQNSPSGTKPKVIAKTVLNSDSGEVRVEYSLSSLRIKVGKSGLKKVIVPGTLSLTIPGFPSLPSQPLHIVLPKEATNVRVEILADESKEIDNIKLEPFVVYANTPHGLVRLKNVKEPEINGLYPYKIYKLSGPDKLRDGNKLVTLTVTPLQYDKNRKQLIIHHHIEFEITFNLIKENYDSKNTTHNKYNKAETKHEFGNLPALPRGIRSSTDTENSKFTYRNSLEKSSLPIKSFLVREDGRSEYSMVPLTLWREKPDAESPAKFYGMLSFRENEVSKAKNELNSREKATRFLHKHYSEVKEIDNYDEVVDLILQEYQRAPVLFVFKKGDKSIAVTFCAIASFLNAPLIGISEKDYDVLDELVNRLDTEYLIVGGQNFSDEEEAFFSTLQARYNLQLIKIKNQKEANELFHDQKLKSGFYNSFWKKERSSMYPPDVVNRDAPYLKSIFSYTASSNKLVDKLEALESSGTNYLVVYSPDMSAAAAKLAAYRSAEAVKTSATSAYDIAITIATYDPVYVALMGDGDPGHVPAAFICDPVSGKEDADEPCSDGCPHGVIATDFYYEVRQFDIGEFEDYSSPDSFVGRVVASNKYYTEQYIDTIIRYENGLLPDYKYTGKAVLGAFGFKDDPDESQETMEYIANVLKDKYGTTPIKLYSCNQSHYENKDGDFLKQVYMNTISSGVSIGFVKTHTNIDVIEFWRNELCNNNEEENVCYNNCLDIDDLKLYSMKNVPFFQYNDGCLTAAFMGTANNIPEGIDPNHCIGNWFLSKGAIGYIGSTMDSYLGYVDNLDKEFFDYLPDKKSLGATLAWAHKAYYDARGRIFSDKEKKTTWEFILIGDPAVKVIVNGSAPHEAPKPHVTSSASNLNLDVHNQYDIVFTVSNSGEATQNGYLTLSVSNGLMIVSVDGHSVSSSTNENWSVGDVHYYSFLPGSTINKCDGSTTTSSYHLIDIMAPYSSGQSRRFTVRVRALNNGETDGWLKYRAAFAVKNEQTKFFVRDPNGGNVTDQQGCYAKVVRVNINHPPNTPSTPQGPSSGYTNTSYSFSTSATDPDGDSLTYRFYWGDDHISAWGSSTQSHSWSSANTYCVKAQARDSHGATSIWSACRYITINSQAPATYQLSVKRSGTGSGTVTSSPSGISCGSDCSNSYTEGTQVTLTATSSSGSVFGGWSGDCSSCGTSATCAVTMNSDKVCTATFNQQSGGNQPPVIDSFRANPPSGQAPLQVTFTCQAYDPDGSVSRYTLSYGDGSSDSNTTGSFTHTYSDANTYTATCTVTDNEGGMAAANVQVYVSSGSGGGQLKWKFETSREIYSSPAIGDDGTIYVGSQDDYIYAINPDGTLKWKYKAEDIVRSSPAVGSDGTIYVGSGDGYLYALKPDGTLKWKYKTGGGIESSPAVGGDGTIYVGSSDHYLYALKPDGTLKWKYDVEDVIVSPPSIGKDGTIYFGSYCYTKYVYALNPDGTLKWRYLTGNTVRSSPAIGDDGTVYVGSEDKYLYAFNPDGTLKWKVPAGQQIKSSPTIGNDGTIYVGSHDRYLYAVNPDGTVKWKFETGGKVLSSPAIGNDGTIYVGSGDRYVYALNPDGTLKWKYKTGGGIYSSPVIGGDGTIYIGSYDHYLYAFSSSSRLANTPWPMFHHDVRHTGDFNTEIVSNKELLLHYTFDSCDATDSSGNGLDGEISGSPQCVAGVQGKALEFDGQDDWIKVDKVFNLKDFTISAWFKTSKDGRQGILQTNDGHIHGLTGIGIVMLNGDDLEIGYRAVQGEGKCEIHAKNMDLADGKWHMLALVRDTSEGKGYLYIDGDLVGNCQDPAPGEEIPSQSYMRIAWGYYYASGSSFFNGMIDDIRVYDYTVSSDKIRDLYQDGVSGVNGGKLLAYYPFDSCEASDVSGNGYDGTIRGGINCIAGKVGKALRFDGSTGYVDLPDFFDYKYLTVCAWIKPEDSSRNQVVVDGWKDVEGFHITYTVSRSSDKCANGVSLSKGFVFGVHPIKIDGGYEYEKHICGSSNIALDQWHFICGTFNGITMKLYEDGKLVARYSYPGERWLSCYSGFGYGSPDLRLGLDRHDQAHFKGGVDELRIYNYALFGSQIEKLYEVGNMRNQLPVIDNFKANSTHGQVPLQIIFTCQAHDPDGSIDHYEITYGDGSSDSNITGSFTHTYQDSGKYTATCKAVDDQGNESSLSTITIDAYIRGDVDGNYIVDIVDALLASINSLGIQVNGNLNFQAADVDEIEGINIDDAIGIAEMALGLQGF